MWHFEQAAHDFLFSIMKQNYLRVVEFRLADIHGIFLFFGVHIFSFFLTFSFGFDTWMVFLTHETPKWHMQLKIDAWKFFLTLETLFFIQFLKTVYQSLRTVRQFLKTVIQSLKTVKQSLKTVIKSLKTVIQSSKTVIQSLKAVIQS